MEIIEIKSHNELPLGVECVLYHAPFYDTDHIREVVTEFKKKYGEPKTIYQHGERFYVVKHD